uniref:Uncharacterized protein n=1 Tax=Timema genevievae TaxID=629358 RepID=A0A7R9K2M4_TIMGE|nr:unnamed protein product [Timema genevievae]
MMQEMDFKNVIYNAARDGKLRRLKGPMILKGRYAELFECNIGAHVAKALVLCSVGHLLRSSLLIPNLYVSHCTSQTLRFKTLCCLACTSLQASGPCVASHVHPFKPQVPVLPRMYTPSSHRSLCCLACTPLQATGPCVASPVHPFKSQVPVLPCLYTLLKEERWTPDQVKKCNQPLYPSPRVIPARYTIYGRDCTRR